MMERARYYNEDRRLSLALDESEDHGDNRF